jgi:hypothetical protein
MNCAIKKFKDIIMENYIFEKYYLTGHLDEILLKYATYIESLLENSNSCENITIFSMSTGMGFFEALLSLYIKEIYENVKINMIIIEPLYEHYKNLYEEYKKNAIFDNYIYIIDYIEEKGIIENKMFELQLHAFNNGRKSKMLNEIIEDQIKKFNFNKVLFCGTDIQVSSVESLRSFVNFLKKTNDISYEINSKKFVFSMKVYTFLTILCNIIKTNKIDFKIKFLQLSGDNEIIDKIEKLEDLCSMM